MTRTSTSPKKAKATKTSSSSANKARKSGTVSSVKKDHKQEKIYIGRRVSKKFDDGVQYGGCVEKYSAKHRLWTIVYDDGDGEEMDWRDLSTAMGLHDGARRKTEKKKRRKTMTIGRAPEAKEAPALTTQAKWSAASVKFPAGRVIRRISNARPSKVAEASERPAPTREVPVAATEVGSSQAPLPGIVGESSLAEKTARFRSSGPPLADACDAAGEQQRSRPVSDSSAASDAKIRGEECQGKSEKYPAAKREKGTENKFETTARQSSQGTCASGIKSPRAKRSAVPATGTTTAINSKTDTIASANTTSHTLSAFHQRRSNRQLRPTAKMMALVQEKEQKKQLRQVKRRRAVARGGDGGTAGERRRGRRATQEKGETPAGRSRQDLKPVLKVGQKVMAAWWPGATSQRENVTPSWFPGTIAAARKSKQRTEYGPVRTYSIVYDDGDKLDNVEDLFVFPALDYSLATRSEAWAGVENVTDSQSRDKWAQYVGWWVADIDGQPQAYSLLSDAVQAYDAATARRKGAQLKPSDLNLPEEHDIVFL